MATKKRHWFWNLLIIFTVLTCITAFVLHYKNWTKIEEGHLRVLSGIYLKKIPLAAINKVDMVDKLPQMERKNGFSWLAREKGIFKDSITQSTVHVFVDDLYQAKIRLTYNDSLQLYFNMADSLATQQYYLQLQENLAPE